MLYVIFTFLIKITVVRSLLCDDILEYSDDKKISMENLQTMQPTEIIDCLAHLAKDQLGLNEADFIWHTLITYYDGIANIPDKVLRQLHWVTVAITPQEYYNVTLSGIEVVENFGLNYQLSPEQLSAIANRVREDFAGKEPEDYTYYDLTALRQILCAFNKSEIERIHPAAYREAALTIGKLEKCSPEALSGFATLAVQKKAFGSPDTWSDSTIEVLGVVADYLPKDLIPRQIETEEQQ